MRRLLAGRAGGNHLVVQHRKTSVMLREGRPYGGSTEASYSLLGAGVASGQRRGTLAGRFFDSRLFEGVAICVDGEESFTTMSRRTRKISGDADSRGGEMLVVFSSQVPSPMSETRLHRGPTRSSRRAERGPTLAQSACISAITPHNMHLARHIPLNGRLVKNLDKLTLPTLPGTP